MMEPHNNPGNYPIRIGISSCLLGEKVRFDASHKRDPFITEILGKYFEWVTVCPELEVGMGVPREAVRLVASGENLRMVGVRSKEDWTGRMVQYAKRRADEIGKMGLSGFILKSKSPSCGMERVRYYSDAGMPGANGPGLFARAIIERFPLLPIEEEGRLNDPELRENFIERIFCYHRLQSLVAERFRRGAMVEFHTIHKYLLLAHSPDHYRRLGVIVASMAKLTSAEFTEQYSALFMEALRVRATVKKNVNVLQHILGYFKNNLTAEEKADVLGAIEDYRMRLVPIVVPMTLVRHFVKKHRIEYIQDQVYLNPHPKEMMLRNHV